MAQKRYITQPILAANVSRSRALMIRADGSASWRVMSLSTVPFQLAAAPLRIAESSSEASIATLKEALAMKKGVAMVAIARAGERIGTKAHRRGMGAALRRR